MGQAEMVNRNSTVDGNVTVTTHCTVPKTLEDCRSATQLVFEGLVKGRYDTLP